MQLNLVSLSLTAAFLLTVVSAYDRRGDGYIRVETEDPAPYQEPKVERVGDSYIIHPDTKRSLPESNRVATAIRRRRALARRGEEADEEEEDEDENEVEDEDEEQGSSEEDFTEGESVDATESDKSANNTEGANEEAELETIESTESQEIGLERRSSVAGGGSRDDFFDGGSYVVVGNYDLTTNPGFNLGEGVITIAH